MRFANLKLMMSHRRVRLFELAAVLKRSDTWLSDRINGHYEFAPHERTRIAEFFGVKEKWLFEKSYIPVSVREVPTANPAVETR